jgi:hypothetical protein
MNSSGILGGTGFLIIDVLAVVLLGLALVYGTMRWRSRSKAQRLAGDRKATELARSRDPDEGT